MSKPVSPLEREIYTFMQNHGGGPFTDEDIDAGVLSRCTASTTTAVDGRRPWRRPPAGSA